MASLLFVAAAAQEPAELKVLIHERHFYAFPALEQVAREFEAAHPGVRVHVLSSASAAGAHEKTRFMLAGGIPLDVTWIDVTELAAYLAEDVLVDLQPYFDADPGWNPDDYFPQVLDGMRDARRHLYGLPSTFTPYVMYVNETLLAREGLAVPPDWSWEQFHELCRRATRENQWGLELTLWLQPLAPWIWQNGGRFLDEHGRCALDEPAAVEAIAFLHRLVHQEQVARPVPFEGQIQFGLFQAGKAAFYGPVGYWETYRFQSIREFEWDVVPLPRHKEAATAIAMRFYCVPAVSRHPQLAYQFVRALGGDAMQRELARIGNGVPGLKRAAASADFLKPGVAPESEHVFLDVLPAARFLPVLSNWKEIEELTKAEFQDCLLLGKTSPAEACARVAAATNDFLDREADLRRRPFLPGWLFAAALCSGAAALAGALLGALRRRPARLAAREERAAWLFLAPWAAGCALFLAGPAAVSLLLSLSEWSPLRPLSAARWMGLDQYRRLAGDATFQDSVRVTAQYALFAVPLQLIAALGLALLLNRRFRGRNAFRTLFYLPTILSPVVLGAVWRWMLDADDGLFNDALACAGVRGPDWLGDPSWILPAFVLLSLWTVGAQMLVFLAGLQAVPPSLQEAARIDGAGAWRRLWHVTLPAISPLLLLNLVAGIINAFQLFAQPYVMTQGGPGNESRFLALYLYEQGFRFLRMGYASTLAWALFLIVLALTLLVLRSSTRWVHYAGAPR
ncbi:MAG: extracellular solute-binding protein [Planctomycetota bacterium]|nr:MAG: extracellular solute-binding protein [Planctomycetota bacterium]